MQTCIDCIPCFVRHSLEMIKIVIDAPQRRERAMREVLETLAIVHLHLSPPYVACETQRIIRKWAEGADPCIEHKRRFNKAAMEMLDELRRIIEQATDPFETAVRIAIAGNIIDFALNADLDESRLRSTIHESLTASLAINDLELLRARAKQAKSILYLGDNAGEIVFDRLLLERLPLKRVTFVVRGDSVLNDATMDDARQTGLTELVRVIDNGSDAPGTILESCSSQLRHAYASADLVIAKGQGNYETLSDENRPGLFFLLKAKCPVVAVQLGVEVGDLVVKSSETVSNDIMSCAP